MPAEQVDGAPCKVTGDSFIRLHLKKLSPYQPILPFEVLSTRLRRKPEDIIKLDANENPYGPPPEATEALGTLKFPYIYPDPESRRLRAALAEDSGVEIDYILAGCGADELIDLIMRCVLDPGDKIVDCPPTFTMYEFDAAVNGALVIKVPREPNFSLNIPHIINVVEKRKPKCIFLTSPNNPDGSVISDEDLLKVLDLPILVILDEAYIEFSGLKSRMDWVKKHDNLIVLRDFQQKSRLSWTSCWVWGISSKHHQIFLRAKQPYNVSRTAEVAACAALQNPGYLERVKNLLVLERERLYKLLEEVPYLKPFPSFSNFILCEVTSGKDAKKLKTVSEGNLLRTRACSGSSYNPFRRFVYFGSFSRIRASPVFWALEIFKFRFTIPAVSLDSRFLFCFLIVLWGCRRTREESAILCLGHALHSAISLAKGVHRFMNSSKDEKYALICSLLAEKASAEVDFFTEYGEGNRYRIGEVIGKGSYGVVCSALDTHTGEKVAIKKINDIFEHVSDATRILREIKLLRLLRHPDIVEIKHILLPPSRREFKDIYVVFELMESDLHQVIKANDDLTPEHYQFFLYQLLRGLKYIHTANVFHRDLKPKNILANADCKLKICDFGLARVAFNDTPTAIFWTDYVATRWCANEKARRYLSSMRKKKPIPFSQKFPNADPLALSLLEKMLAFEPKDRPTAEEALADPYFRNIAKVEREPSAQPVTKMEFEFERRRVTKEDIRELIYREILEYHPKLLKEFLEGEESTNFMYPSAVDQFKKQFAYLEENYGKGGTFAPPERQHASLPRPSVFRSENSAQNSSDVTVEFSKCSIKEEKPQPQHENSVPPVTKFPLQISQRAHGSATKPGKMVSSMLHHINGPSNGVDPCDSRRVTRNPSIPTQYASSNCSYPRRNPSCKNERGEDDTIDGSTMVQSKPYMTRKVAAAHSGPSSLW
ncbi:hypothetical protein HPP92_015450 [Vanilla planifolia]|uniref:histidinol-phosphate transaminase n=2 Tax=Magnoliopsida TaxID=3398 RepID=A0A835UU22_VANPL|nr:hypothetical protein HPP92_015450 [Vanilla planifolia]